MERLRMNKTSFIRNNINLLDEIKDNSLIKTINSSYYIEKLINSNYKPLSNKNSARIKIFKLNSKGKRNTNSFFNISNIKEDEKNNSSFSESKIKELFNKKILIKGDRKEKEETFDRNENIFIKRNKTFNEGYFINNSFNIKNSFVKNNKENLQLKSKLKELKERLNNNIKKHMIFDKYLFERYNLLFKAGMKTKFKTYIKNIDKAYEDCSINSNNQYKRHYEINKNAKKNSSFKINNYYNCFSVFKSTFRYQDGFLTPKEFLKKYFDKKEISLIKSSPKYFGLNKAPFKFEEQIYNPSLCDRIQIEDCEMEIKSYKEKEDNKKLNEQKIKHDKMKEKYSIDENLLKEHKRKIFIKLLKLNKNKIINDIQKKHKLIKMKPFTFHYERDIDPQEGTVAFFEKRFDKYLKNKIRELKLKMKNNRDNIYKFEFQKKKIIKNLKKQNYSKKYSEIITKNYLNINKMAN